MVVRGTGRNPRWGGRLVRSLEGRWSASYPETTGYIIPTFLALAEARAEPQARERALRMADWEGDIQMEDGAVLSGVLGTPRGPAVFNTGQALFGWIAAFEASGNERYASAARAAAEWLVSHQDPDGAWRRDLSAMTSAPVHTYNNRCSWALAVRGERPRGRAFPAGGAAEQRVGAGPAERGRLVRPQRLHRDRCPPAAHDLLRDRGLASGCMRSWARPVTSMRRAERANALARLAAGEGLGGQARRRLAGDGLVALPDRGRSDRNDACTAWSGLPRAAATGRPPHS